MDQTWKYSRDHEPSAPVVTASIGPLTVELLVDTGFAGGVLIPFPLFQSLGLETRHLPDKYSAVMPDSRRVILHTALADVRIDPVKVRTTVHSSPALDRRLVGRETLRSFRAVLDGPEETLSLSLRAP